MALRQIYQFKNSLKTLYFKKSTYCFHMMQYSEIHIPSLFLGLGSKIIFKDYSMTVIPPHQILQLQWCSGIPPQQIYQLQFLLASTAHQILWCKCCSGIPLNGTFQLQFKLAVVVQLLVAVKLEFHCKVCFLVTYSLV